MKKAEGLRLKMKPIAMTPGLWRVDELLHYLLALGLRPWDGHILLCPDLGLFDKEKCNAGGEGEDEHWRR